jgi:hypothetical protein
MLFVDVIAAPLLCGSYATEGGRAGIQEIQLVMDSSSTLRAACPGGNRVPEK